MSLSWNCEFQLETLRQGSGYPLNYYTTIHVSSNNCLDKLWQIDYYTNFCEIKSKIQEKWKLDNYLPWWTVWANFRKNMIMGSDLGPTNAKTFSGQRLLGLSAQFIVLMRAQRVARVEIEKNRSDWTYWIRTIPEI